MTKSTINANFNFDNSYARQMEGFYTEFNGDALPAPKILSINHSLINSLGIEINNLTSIEMAQIFSGSVSPEGANPLAQVYAGHQFGGFSSRLGDGRALLMGEVIDSLGQRFDIHLKGSGRTPYSRGGDGKAAVGPVLREYIMGEAMHALHVPTTRGLAVVLTGEMVMREEPLPGAVLARIAKSHLRVGTFEYFAARNETNRVKQLADYTIARHFSDLQTAENPYQELLREVCQQQASLITKWMLLGFVHGVMNTDNMTISGETIDYGPCAFIDTYDLSTVFSSIDSQGRYAYGNQPQIAQWNLTRLAETLLPLIHSDTEESIKIATEEINAFPDYYQQYWTNGMREKLGLATHENEDLELANLLFKSMENQNVDFTRLFRGLAKTLQGNTEPVRNLFNSPENFDSWHVSWTERMSRDTLSTEDRIKAMNHVNPIYIPRNHKVEEALQAAEKYSNYSLYEKLIQVLTEPFNERAGLDEYANPAPNNTLPYRTFCGT